MLITIQRFFLSPNLNFIFLIVIRERLFTVFTLIANIICFSHHAFTSTIHCLRLFDSQWNILHDVRTIDRIFSIF